MQGPSPMHLMHQMSKDQSEFRDKSINAETRRRVWSFAKPYKSMIVGFLLTLVVASVLAALPPMLFRQIIDRAIVDKDRSYLNLIAGIIVAAAFASAGLALLERWWSARIGEGLIYDLRSSLYDHVQRMPISFFTRSQTGTLISRLNNDVIGAQRAFTGTLGSVVSNLISLITTLIAMFYLEWRLTLLALVLLPLFVVPAKRVGRGLQQITREGMELNASMNNTMTERFNVSGALLVKLFGDPTVEQAEFSDRAGQVRNIGVRSAMYSRTFMIALTLVGSVGTAAIYWIGGRLAISDSISIGTLAALSLYVVRIYTPLTSLTGARVDIMSAYVSFERVFEVLDTPNPIIDSPDASDLVDARGEIEFDDVSFGYPEPGGTSLAELAHDKAPTELVLHDINLTIPAGSLVAVVGPSGAGKSTLTSLLPRLYDVTTGALRIDGHDIRELTQQSLRDSIGVVSQDPHMFHDTVGANLRFGRPHATEAEMRTAAEAARIAGVINAL
ncbi:MAG: ABC transporter ATP-binding protein, partial [Acidimicrobiales bacterium]